MIDKESGSLVIGEETRDSEFSKFLLGQKADDVSDVVGSKGPGKGVNMIYDFKTFVKINHQHSLTS